MKLYVWEDADVMVGSVFNGTICAIAESPDEARAAVRLAYLEHNTDVHRIGWGNSPEEHARGLHSGTSYWQMLEKTLGAEPVERTVVFCDGGDL